MSVLLRAQLLTDMQLIEPTAQWQKRQGLAVLDLRRQRLPSASGLADSMLSFCPATGELSRLTTILKDV